MPAIRDHLRNCLRLTAFAFASLAIANPAAAQNYPNGPVRLVVPFAAGGSADALARAVAAQLSKMWGHQVYIENKGGANTQIGASFVAKSPNDGYTLMVTSEGTFVMNPLLFDRLQYDPASDFTPITTLVALKQALVVGRTLKVKTLKEVVEIAKRSPGKLTYGTNGFGSSSHLNMEMLKLAADIDLTAIHYKGAGPAIADLIGGHISMTFISPGDVLEHEKAGTVSVVATGSLKRIAALPDIPSIAESGFPGFDGTSWFGLFAPAGTPQAIVQKISADVTTIMNDPEFRQKHLRATLLEADVRTPEEFGALILEGRKRWGDVITRAKLKAK